METHKVDKFFASIKDREIAEYNDYWGELKPQSNAAIFRRYLFAFMSVHTSWKNNCKGYNAIKQFTKWQYEEEPQMRLWNYDSDDLFRRIKETRVGMQNNRTNYIGRFLMLFGAILVTTSLVILVKDGLSGVIGLPRVFLGWAKRKLRSQSK